MRLINYSDKDQLEDRPYSSKQLRQCYRQGAEKFGWSHRDPQPRSMKDGNELVGWGMATGIWEAMQVKASATAVLTANGSVEIASATADIGPGTYTMMTQLGAEMLGVPLENVTAKLGDSDLPQQYVIGHRAPDSEIRVWFVEPGKPSRDVTLQHTLGCTSPLIMGVTLDDTPAPASARRGRGRCRR